MKLAVRKEEGRVPGGGFHYLLAPIRFESDSHARLWELMGYIVIDVDNVTGERLLAEAGAALKHQCEVAVITEDQLRTR